MAEDKDLVQGTLDEELEDVLSAAHQAWPQDSSGVAIEVKEPDPSDYDLRRQLQREEWPKHRSVSVKSPASERYFKDQLDKARGGRGLVRHQNTFANR